MGYEVKLIIGKSHSWDDEIEKDKTKPFNDGSGFPYKKDKKGNYVKTGRKESYFEVMATLDLCKLGYQKDPLNDLIDEAKSKAKTTKDKKFYYFYADDGNTQITEDRYGDFFYPVPIKEVLEAMKLSEDAKTYRRLIWAIALLESMQNDSEKLEVLFFGH